MTIYELRPADTPDMSSSGMLAVPPSRRERLAIISTRNELCGIAAYTQALERHLADIFDITVFDLDQYLLRGQHPRVRALGDRHIQDICHRIADFDAVNLQLEHGTLGRSAKDIDRRFRRLIAAAPRLSVTFHTLHRPPVFPFADFAQSILKLKWRQAEDIRAFFSRHTRLSVRLARHLRLVQQQKPVSVIVHNRRDASDARHLYGFDRVFDHPLSFLSAAEADFLLAQATRRNFTQLDALPADAALIGVFGFLNDYKGFGTVVRALHHLPKNYHLLIFGGVHPNEIPARTPIHPYLASLLDDAHVDAVFYDQMRSSASAASNVDVDTHFTRLFGRHPRDLSQRLHFMGAADDTGFLAGMAICDAVVLPYLEVGQSASGPISQAVELGCRVIASRTHTFLEFARYHPDTVEFFDIGNHLELAERIAARRQYESRRERLTYTAETNKAIYLAANSAPTETVERFHRGSAPATKIKLAR
jgi:glycosyltransferase involved in cell wall biosynthesis